MAELADLVEHLVTERDVLGVAQQLLGEGLQCAAGWRCTVGWWCTVARLGAVSCLPIVGWLCAAGWWRTVVCTRWHSGKHRERQQPGHT